MLPFSSPNEQLMRESFLHYLWRTRRFDATDLCTTDGQKIEIQQVGELNTHAGPDFFDARIRIGQTVWAGNIEMHLKASEWMAHRHDTDRAYDNVILHVVLENDLPIVRPHGEQIPCLELKNRIPPTLLDHYERLEAESLWIPCQHFFPTVPDIVKFNWLDRVLVERLEQKTAIISDALSHTGNHWEEAFYHLLARSFGLKINVDPFETLARSTPLLILAKHKSSLLQIEALLFGQAGMLNRPFKDEWPRLLVREYRHLAHKYGLTPMEASQWKFLRLRPANFPTVRLAQFAALVHHSSQLFSKILEARNLREIEHLLEVQTSPYWLHHFQFDKPSIAREKNLGKAFIHTIVINTIVPCLFHYGMSRQLEGPKKKALALLEEIPAENNALLDAWALLGLQTHNAFQSQALIHLKTRYCDAKKCLECSIGHAVLK